MPKRKNYNKKKKGNNRKYTNPSIKKLLSHKNDTLIEKVAQRVAQKEINKNQLVSLKRSYVWARYDPDNNLWGVLQNPAPFNDWVRVDYRGRVFCLNNFINTIDHTTQQMGGNAGIQLVDDPQTAETETALHAAGANLISAGDQFQSLHGERYAQTIKIKGFSCTIRVTYDREDVENESDEYARCQLRCAIIRVKSTDEVNDLIQQNGELSADDLMTWRHIGYDSRIDKVRQTVNRKFVKRTLAKRNIYIKSSFDYSYEKTFRIFSKIKSPQICSYGIRDYQGLNPKEYRYYLVIRSSIPPSANDAQKPIIMACTKTFYLSGNN